MKSTISTRVDNVVLLKIKAAAFSKGMSVSELLKRIIDDAFKEEKQEKIPSNKVDHSQDFERLFAEIENLKGMTNRAQRDSIFCRLVMSEGKNKEWIDNLYARVSKSSYVPMIDLKPKPEDTTKIEIKEEAKKS
jgi:hypothetical protein